MSNNISWLEARLNGAGKPVVIDGGMGTLLEQSGVPMDSQVWSGRAVLTHPEAVLQAQQHFDQSPPQPDQGSPEAMDGAL